jgi:hypothetical protein
MLWPTQLHEGSAASWIRAQGSPFGSLLPADGVLTKPTSFSGAAVDCLQFSMLETGTQQSQAVHVAVHPAWLTAAATQQQAMATLVTALKQWACNLKGIKGDPTTILKAGGLLQAVCGCMPHMVDTACCVC